ncbi:MAG: alanine dehydrogenase [Planctomycetaceae bacterium]|jgi:alanine dehydrogenase
MTTDTSVEYPIRAAVFETVAGATQAVKALRTAGFSEDQISVICSQEHADKHFGGCREEMVGDHAMAIPDPSAIAALGIGGTAFASAIVLSGGGALIALGAFATVTLAGTLASFFASRGVATEVADFHEQALQAGDLLVAVEVHGDDTELWLSRAENVFHETGAKPVSLDE